MLSGLILYPSLCPPLHSPLLSSLLSSPLLCKNIILVAKWTSRGHMLTSQPGWPTHPWNAEILAHIIFLKISFPEILQPKAPTISKHLYQLELTFISFIFWLVLQLDYKLYKEWSYISFSQHWTSRTQVKPDLCEIHNNDQIYNGVNKRKWMKGWINEISKVLTLSQVDGQLLHKLHESVSFWNSEFLSKTPLKKKNLQNHPLKDSSVAFSLQIHFIERIFSALMMLSALQHMKIRSN